MDVPQYSIHQEGSMKNRVIFPICIFVLLTLLLPAVLPLQKLPLLAGAYKRNPSPVWID